MTLPAPIKALLIRFAATFPLPQGQPGKPHEARCSAWSVKFAEQVAHDFPGEGYGVKKATAGRPISKDSLAKNSPTLMSWDLMLGAGTGKPKLAPNPTHHDIPNQVFVPVTPTNHLGAPEPEPVPPPVPPLPPAPVPCRPAQSYAVMEPFGVEIGELLSVEGSPYRGNLPAACQVAVYLTHKIQFQDWTLEQARRDARERAGG